MKDLVETLLKHNVTISSCESFTGGLFASTLTSFPGVSLIYKGSIITYSNEFKESILGIDHQVINQLGVINKLVALEMARKTLQLTNSDICVSFTGNAGPNPMENKDVGVCYIAFVSKNKEFVSEYKFKGTRNRIRRSAVNKAIHIILEVFREDSYSNVL